jgi:hypothetical protein
LAKPTAVTDTIEASSAPFSSNHLSQIFQVSTKHPDRLISRENGWLEFKASFNWAGREEYARTIAAFANNKGGYLVFGVKDKPHVVVGVDVKRIEAVDPADMTRYLNDVFGVEIAWEAKAVDFAGKPLLLLYVFPAARKPVIAAVTGDKRHLIEGEIYYRYRGRTQRIRYTELQLLLEEQRRSEQASWLRLLRQIARVGIQNTALVDLTTGKGVGPGSSFLIEESLLSQIKFLKQGEFVEKKGAPAIRLIGDASAMPSGIVGAGKKMLVAKAINTPDIVRAFLHQEKVSEPLDYVNRICFEASAFLPVYYFLHRANVSRSEAIARLNGLSSTNPSRHKLIQRLAGADALFLPPPKDTSSEGGRLRALFIERHRAKSVRVAVGGGEVKHAVKAIRSLAPQEIDHAYCYGLLQAWFDKYYGGNDAGLSDEIRRAICYLDHVRYRDVAVKLREAA